MATKRPTFRDAIESQLEDVEGYGLRDDEARHTTMPVGERVPEDVPDETAAVAAEAPPVNTRETRAALGGYAPVGTMLGFRTDGYGGDQKAANSVKNTFGRIASRYGNDASGLEALMADADFKRYFPNAQLGPEGGRGGMIDFGGVLSDFESGDPVGLVDVLNAFDGSSAQGWQWLDQNAPPDPVAASARPSGSGLPSVGGGGEDTLAAIMELINQYSRGDDPLLREALERQLR